MSEEPNIRIATVSDPSWSVVVFMQADGGADIVITSPDSPRKPTNIVTGPPPAGKAIIVIRHSDGTVDVVYGRKP